MQCSTAGRERLRAQVGVDPQLFSFLEWYVGRHVCMCGISDPRDTVRALKLLKRLLVKTSVDVGGDTDALETECWLWTGYTKPVRTSSGAVYAYPEAMIKGRHRFVQRFLYLCKHAQGYLAMVLNKWRDVLAQDADGQNVHPAPHACSQLYHRLHSRDLDGTHPRQRPRFAQTCGNRLCVNVTHIDTGSYTLPTVCSDTIPAAAPSLSLPTPVESAPPPHRPNAT